MKKTSDAPEPLRQHEERHQGDFKAGREWRIQEYNSDRDLWFNLEDGSELTTRQSMIDGLDKIRHQNLDRKRKFRGYNVRLELTLDEINAKQTIGDIMDKAFNTPRERRSEEYMAGARRVIEWRRDGIRTKYPCKTLVQKDAYYAGCREGHDIADRLGIPRRSPHTGEAF